MNPSASRASSVPARVHDSSFDLFDTAAELGFGELHFKHDRPSGLRAVIAVHSTRLGPAFGGTRCRPYPSTRAAVIDAMRLARGMSYKAAVAGVPYGGGKGVILRPAEPFDRRVLFEAYADVLEALGGRYITAVDSGTGVQDMDVIATRTSYVTSTSHGRHASGDPSPFTALGVYRGIEAAVRFRLKRANLEDLHVAIQGVGHVGYHLARELHGHGVRLTVCDMNSELVQRCVDEFGAASVEPERIFGVKGDVFAPCALGGVLNGSSIARLNCGIVCGAANNQLLDDADGDRLQARGIFYVPDYVVNAGGLLHAIPGEKPQLREQVLNIYDTLLSIFVEADRHAAAPFRIADRRAEAILYGEPK